MLLVRWMGRTATINCMMVVFCLSTLALACKGSGKSSRMQVVVYAAASTMDLMTEAADLFAESSGIDAVFEFSSSGSLARKIEAGSPTDVFISANESWIQYVVQKQLIDSAGSFIFARNTLVCVEPMDEMSGIITAEDLPRAERLSLGDPEHVPAGSYAKQALVHYGLWKKFNAEGKTVLAVNVRAALSNVELGDVSVGMVYATDAARSSRVRTLFAFDERSHGPIAYHTALVSNSAKKKEAGEFIRFLASDEFQTLLDKYGFRRP